MRIVLRDSPRLSLEHLSFMKEIFMKEKYYVQGHWFMKRDVRCDFVFEIQTTLYHKLKHNMCLRNIYDHFNFITIMDLFTREDQYEKSVIFMRLFRKLHPFYGDHTFDDFIRMLFVTTCTYYVYEDDSILSSNLCGDFIQKVGANYTDYLGMSRAKTYIGSV